MKLRERFNKAAHITTEAAGSPLAVGLAFGFVVGWLIGGVAWFGFGDSYQMIVNTTTTIVTFLLGFLILAATNRSAKANAMKQDELLRAVRGARDDLMGLEEADDEKIATVEQELRAHRRQVEGK